MVQGLKSLERKLTRTIPARVRLATRAAMEKGANEIVALAKTWVPVKSGALRDSIGWTWGDAPEGSIIMGTVRPSKDGDERITIYAGTRNKNLGDKDAFYVRFVEFGTQNAPPSPFFYPAYRTLKKRTKSRITRETRKALKAAVK